MENLNFKHSQSSENRRLFQIEMGIWIWLEVVDEFICFVCVGRLNFPGVTSVELLQLQNLPKTLNRDGLKPLAFEKFQNRSASGFQLLNLFRESSF